MPKKKSLPSIEIVEDDPLAELWREIDSRNVLYEEPRETDIDAKMIAARYKISCQSAGDRMEKMAKTGEWKIVWVKGAQGERPRTVLRKVSES